MLYLLTNTRSSYSSYRVLTFQLCSSLTDQTVICEGATGQLSCSNGRVIKVLFANYGRLDAHTCPHHTASDNTNCRAENSLARAQESCQDKANCQLQAKNGIFGEPCKKIRKYLLVNYRCEM